MKTDTDALAAYAEAWKPGDPLPAGMEIEHKKFDGSTYTWIRYGGCYQSVESWILDGCPEWQVRLLAQMAEALTGVLVVELARRPAKKGCYPDDILYWAAKGLPGVVRLWLEVNK